jgi:hypothetical protein
MTATTWPRPAPGLLQRLVQGREFRLPPHEGGQPPCRQGLQARAGRAGARQLEHLHGRGQPLDRHRAQGGDMDESFGQSEGGCGQPDTARRGELLHTRCQVRGLTHGRVVHVQVVANRSHHDFPGVESYARLHLQPI